MRSVGSVPHRDGEQSVPTVILCCRQALSFPWQFVRGSYGGAPFARLWRRCNTCAGAASRPATHRAADSAPCGPDRQTRFGLRPRPDGGRRRPPAAPLNRPDQCAASPVRRRPTRNVLACIAAAVVRRRSSSLYLSEPAENEIRQKMFGRHSILREFLKDIGEQVRFWQWVRKPSATVWRKRVAHGESRGEKCAITKSPVRGRQNCGRREFPFAASRLRFIIPEPTADAVGYHLPLLRSLANCQRNLRNETDCRMSNGSTFHEP